MVKLGEYLESEGQSVDPLMNEIAITKQLIKERDHPLELLRELISNSAAREVGATKIEIKYTVDDKGHIFEVKDDGCGMDFTNNKQIPGRLDKFLGLGFSEIIGVKSDEFSWKGLGSKLAYQSRKIEIETWKEGCDAFRVNVNEPWSTIERSLLPNPRVYRDKPEQNQEKGTSVKVYGHPPHKRGKQFSLEEIKNYLLHRTFIGFTREREVKPKIYLSVLNQIVELEVGFPELLYREPKEGTVFVDEEKKATLSGKNTTISVWMKGFYTWDAEEYGLDKKQMNTGLILSVKGIPYCELDMEEYGSSNLFRARPGKNKCCLIVECDQLQQEMNIARNGLVDSEMTDLFKIAVQDIFHKIEKSSEFKAFLRVKKDRSTVSSADELSVTKKKLGSENQRWVVYQPTDEDKPMMLCREPKYESDVLCILWKLESLGALPFNRFETLAYVGSGKKGGPDIIAHFQIDGQSEPEVYATVEIETKFYSYNIHGHKPSQFPKVICWEVGESPKIKVRKSDKKFMYTGYKDETQILIFCIRLMDGIRVMTGKELYEYLE